MKNKVRQKLPKWFDELSMYDLIKGAEMVLQMATTMDNDACYDIIEKGCAWFRNVNPKAYMTLLD